MLVIREEVFHKVVTPPKNKTQVQNWTHSVLKDQETVRKQPAKK